MLRYRLSGATQADVIDILSQESVGLWVGVQPKARQAPRRTSTSAKLPGCATKARSPLCFGAWRRSPTGPEALSDPNSAQVSDRGTRGRAGIMSPQRPVSSAGRATS